MYLLGLDNMWLRYNYLKIWNLRVQIHQNIDNIAFKFAQMKFLAIHITNQKLSFDLHEINLLHKRTILKMCVYVYISIIRSSIYMCVYIYIYIYILVLSN